MKTAKQVFTDEWIATFGNDDVILKELEIVLKHDYIFEAMKVYAREACVAFAKNITDKDSPYAICYGEITPFTTNTADFTCEEVVDNFLTQTLPEGL